MNAMQCVFTGPPRVGKSSFWQRVLGIMPEGLIASTDIISSEGSVRINIRGTCGFAVNMSALEWKKLLVEEEMEGFVALVTQGDILQHKLFQETLKASDVESNVIQPVTMEETIKPIDVESSVMQPIKKQQAPVKSSENLQPDDSIQGEESEALVIPSTTPEKEGQTVVEKHISNEATPSPSQVLEQALIMMRQAEVTKNIDSASFVYFTDTGGQPEFQEALSLLMAGLNTVLIILNLEQDIHSNPPLEYLPSLEEPPVQYYSPHTVGEMLCQSLMSVPVGEDKEEEDEGTCEGMQNTASVFFIGTHKDTVTPERIKEMNRELTNLIKDTPQYQRGMVKHCSANDVIFAVNNFSPLQNDEDFIPVRRAIQSLVYGNNRFKVKARTSWLFMGIVFQKLSESQPIISLDQYQEIARQCSITGK